MLDLIFREIILLVCCIALVGLGWIAWQMRFSLATENRYFYFICMLMTISIAITFIFGIFVMISIAAKP